MSESGPPEPAETPADVTAGSETSGSSGGMVSNLKDSISYPSDMEINPVKFLKRFARTEPEVDIKELTQEYGTKAKAHTVAFVRKFLGTAGMPAIGHAILAVMSAGNNRNAPNDTGGPRTEASNRRLPDRED